MQNAGSGKSKLKLQILRRERKPDRDGKSFSNLPGRERLTAFSFGGLTGSAEAFADLITTLDELNSLGVSFVSLNESLDLTTPSGKALAGMLAVFAEFEREILRERVRAGIAEARSKGKQHGRPATAAKKKDEVKKLYKNGKGLSKSEIARKLKIGRTSVIRLLNEKLES